MTAFLPVAPVERGNPSIRIYASDLVEIGRFWCSPRHPEFRTVGTITQPTFVFPETAVWIQHEGAMRFLGSPARVTLYNTGQQYTRHAHDADGDRCLWFAVSDDLARDVVAARDPAAADSDRVLAFAYGPVAPAACLEARRLARRALAPHADALLVEEGIVNLFTGVIAGIYDQAGARAGLTARQHEIVEAVASRLYRTCTENHTLSELARAVDISVFHLCRLFRRASGTTMHVYRHHVRLARALDALGSPGVDLLGLAVDLGYSSHSHFTSTFRRQFGLAPSQARAQLAAASKGRLM